MRKLTGVLLVMAMALALMSAGCSSSDSDDGNGVINPDGNGNNNNGDDALIVNSLQDTVDPGPVTTTLRAALKQAKPGETIRFDESLDGGVIQLSVVGDAHTVLKGEVMGMDMTPSGPVSYLEGYFDRDYGPSALYAQKDVVIDASNLPSGITLAWTGGAENPARVMAVYGDLALTNVTITGGRSVAVDISTDDPDGQPWTLARGGALAVWGKARLEDCTLYDNHCIGDFDQSRDRGAFGGGLYADIVEIENCIVAGNTVIGAGAAGGGVYSVGGADANAQMSTIKGSAITGNRISGLFAYGAGVYSDGGGIGNRKYLELTNSTLAWNLAEPAPDLPPFMLGMGYWRGGGIYMSNGYLHMRSCTVVDNAVHGVPRTDDLSKANLAGGVAATIGNAHAVEEMVIGQSIVAGNTIHELDAGGETARTYGHDLFTGSLLHFKSRGYNRFGVMDFSQILVPVGETDWESLARKHYPKTGDMEGLAAVDVLDTPDDGAAYSDHILSAGVHAGDKVVLYYPPAGTARDAAPASYAVEEIYAEYAIPDEAEDNFLAILLDRIETHYSLAGFSDEFTADFEAYLQTVDTDEEAPGNQPYTDPDGDPILTLADTQWFGPAETWPSNVANYAYIDFWHRLDEALRAENIPGMGPELMGDEAWSALFSPGPLAENPDIVMTVITDSLLVTSPAVDQRGASRPVNERWDIGAIEGR